MPASSLVSRALRIASIAALPPGCVAALESSHFGPFAVDAVADVPAWLARFDALRCDALIVDGDADDVVARLAADTAIVVVVERLDEPGVVEWLARGAQDLLSRDELGAASFPLRLRAAIERKRLERDARSAYATDLDTGLPHRQQLIEHMSQLIALREREPAPMALLLLRIEGLATAQVHYGRESANALRRKIGVRLRVGVRASDVVASLGAEQFAVLLGSILNEADAAQVGAKLLRALMEPFKIAGDDVAVAAALGVALYPQDGAQPDALLDCASAALAAAPARGRPGFSNFQETGGLTASAANDD